MRHLFRAALLLTTALAAPVAAHAADERSGEVSELVVTAQKREQRLQDVPLPVSAIGEAQLAAQGVTTTVDLTRAVPGLIFVKNAAFSQPSIRGIGTKSSAAGDAGSVALYIDGVYVASSQGGQFDLGYIERVEVLKGPQGTLFGRNATGGAINIITRTPQEGFFAEAQVGYASYNWLTAKGYMTGSIAPGLKADFQAFYSEDSGYIRHIVSGDHLKSVDNYGARMKVVWDVTDDFSLTGAVDHTMDSGETAYSYFALGGRNSVTRANPNAIIARQYYTVSTTFTPFNSTLQNSVALTADWDLGPVNLKSITGYRFMRNTDWLDQDQTPLPSSALLIRAFSQDYTQEFIATSTGDTRLSWLAGFFFFKEKAGRDPNITYTNGVAGARTDAVIKTEAYAPYGELTFKVTDNFNLIGGLRYSHEKKRLINSSARVLRLNVNDTWENTSYRVTGQYIVNSSLNFYATHSTGFKSGAYNSTSFTNPPVFPETVDAYELGAKYSQAGITINSDIFQYDWHNIQIQRSVDPATGTTLLQNAAEGRIRGIEVEARAPVGEDFTVTFAGTYMKGIYRAFPGADVLLPFTNLQVASPGNPARPCGTAGGTAIGGNCNASVNASGNPLFRTPKLSFTLGLNYRHEFAGGVVGAAASLYHVASFSWEPGNRVREPAHDLANARLSWSPASERFKIEVWGDNLTDEYYNTNVNTSTGGDIANPGAPRRFGVTLSVKTS